MTRATQDVLNAFLRLNTDEQRDAIEQVNQHSDAIKKAFNEDAAFRSTFGPVASSGVCPKCGQST
jgi:hypothetical protein